MSSEKKIGFWSVTSLVAGSQIGSGIFLLPASLGLFGSIGLASWLITATGALLLALVFARLCARIPKTGGPHAYIETVFGKKIAFFSAWTYWVISWLSSTAVVLAIVGYLSPILGNLTTFQSLVLEIAILFLVTFLNLRGVGSAGRAEFIFTVLKILPLLIVPIAGLFFMNAAHFVPFNPTTQTPFAALNAAALLTLWGFIGVESATTPAESVNNPSKTIPKAIIVGTLVVALVYILNSVAVMGVVPREILAQSKAPFADAVTLMFGGNWHLLISIVTAIVCFGTLNAWMLTSGQIALGAANDGLFPKIFKKTNRQGAPLWSLIISSLGMIPFLILTLDVNLVTQVNFIIDIAVTAFLFVYVMSVLSYLVIFWKSASTTLKGFLGWMMGIGALTFCGWALWSSGLKMVGFAAVITLTGLPIYGWQNKRAHRATKTMGAENAVV